MGRAFDDDLTVLDANGIRREDRLDGDHLVFKQGSQLGVALVTLSVVREDRIGGKRLQHAVHIELCVGLDIGGDRFGECGCHEYSPLRWFASERLASPKTKENTLNRACYS